MSPLISMQQSPDCSSDEEDITQPPEPILTVGIGYKKTAAVIATSAVMAAQIVSRFNVKNNSPRP